MENLEDSRHISQTHSTAFNLLSMEQRDYPEKQKEGAALYQEMKLPQLTSHMIENWGNKQTSICLSLIRTLQHDQINFKVVWEVLFHWEYHDSNWWFKKGRKGKVDLSIELSISITMPNIWVCINMLGGYWFLNHSWSMFMVCLPQEFLWMQLQLWWSRDTNYCHGGIYMIGRRERGFPGSTSA